MIYSSKRRPCPVCGRTKDGDCRWSDRDGVVKYLCRTGRGRDLNVIGFVYMKDSKCGTWGVYLSETDAFRDSDDDGFRPQRRRQKQQQASILNEGAAARAASAARPSCDPDARLRNWLAHQGRDMTRLPGSWKSALSFANELGLPDPCVFEQVEAGRLVADDRNRGDVLCIPERDGEGAIIGYSLRYHRDTGEKCKYAVGRRGLIIPKAITPSSCIHDGPLYLVEGASDTLTLLTMKRNVIGRPSATGGADYLVEFIRRLPRERWGDIVVVGENDQHPDRDLWPGREGAYRIAQRIANDLGVIVRVAFPPAGAKDVRDWFLQDLKRAKTKDWVRSHADYSAVGWDNHVFFSADRVRPGEKPKYTAQTSPYASQLIAHTVAALCTPLADLSDFTPERIEPLAEEAKRLRKEEAAAASRIKELRSDFGRFPCSRPRYIALERRRDGAPFVIECRCQKRGCLGCRQWLDERELTNANLRFSVAEKSGMQLSRYECKDEKEWKSLYLAIWRSGGGDYLRAAKTIDGDSWIVFTSCSVASSASGDWHSRGQKISKDAALSEIRSLLLLQDADAGRPISASHGWKLPKTEEKSNNFMLVGKVDSEAIHQLGGIADAVDADVIPLAPKRPDGSLLRMWKFQRRGDWPPTVRDHLYGCLFVGEILPFRERDGGDGGGGGDPQKDAMLHPFDALAT